MVIGYDASGGIKSFLFFYFLVIYMTRAGETGLSWMTLLSLYVLILFLFFVPRSVCLCLMLAFFFSFFSLLGRPALMSPTLLSSDGCSMIDSWSCINTRVLFWLYH